MGQKVTHPTPKSLSNRSIIRKGGHGLAKTLPEAARVM